MGEMLCNLSESFKHEGHGLGSTFLMNSSFWPLLCSCIYQGVRHGNGDSVAVGLFFPFLDDWFLMASVKRSLEFIHMWTVP